MSRLKILSVMLAITLFARVEANTLGTYGTTYKVVEKDAYEELMEKVKNIDMSRYYNELKAEIKNYKPENRVTLKRAKKEREFQFTPVYTLPFDIPDQDGKILYPRGYTFNPLDYIRIPDLVVIDGSDPEQVKWFENSKYSKDINIMLLITEGSYWSLSERLLRPVFYADQRIVERLNLKQVPSIVKQKGNTLIIKEVFIEDKDNK